jgi:intein/homing endonuclease
LKLYFSDREITVTDDHPFWREDQLWASINPTKSNENYEQNSEVVQLKIGDRVFVPTKNKFISLMSIEKVEKKQSTYTIELTNGNNFIANGLVVKVEKPLPAN